jgi:hypothetical protein
MNNRRCFREDIEGCLRESRGKQCKAKAKRTTPQSKNSGNTFTRTRGPRHPSCARCQESLQKGAKRNNLETHPRSRPTARDYCLAHLVISSANNNPSSPHREPQTSRPPNRIGNVAQQAENSSMRHTTQTSCMPPAPLQACMQSCCEAATNKQPRSQVVIGRNGILRLGRLPSITAYQ